ncbi:MAG: hypothetical protein M1812_000909 [Candelaria pacifica]|nr:MAG: hypothetical protein M1812_000909 [Candelaria pacifica]
MAAQSSTLVAQISAHLAEKSLSPTSTWLQAFISSQRPTTPLAALKQTALFRLLASDITTSLLKTPANCFPSDVHNAEIKERRLKGPIAVQVLGMEDMGKSRWEQVEAIEAMERGEGTKGREVIRVVPHDEGGSQESVVNSGGPHKILMQDAKGARVYGIELKEVQGVGLGMSVGSKMVLRNAIVARGVLLLEPGTANYVGGKIDNLHKAWKEGRKEELKAAAGITR